MPGVDQTLTRGDDLGVVGRDRRGDDDDVGVREVAGSVTAVDGRAHRREATGDLGVAQVGAGDLVAEVDQDLSDPAHTDAADADEVDVSVALTKHASWIGRSAVNGALEAV